MKGRVYYGWLGTIIVLLTCFAAVILSPSSSKKMVDAPLAPPGGTALFLDQPVPPKLIPHPADPHLKSTISSPFLQFNSFADRLTNLQAMAQRPVVYPAGFVDFIQTEDSKSNWDKGFVLFSTERDGSPAGKTMRDYLTASFYALTLTWQYDSVRDAISTDFKWHRDDPRTNGQLLDVLLHAPSSASKPLWLQLIDLYLRATRSHSQTGWLDPHREYYFNHHKLDPDDSWRIAFDALLSKPENFLKVWKLRFIDDARNYSVPGFVDNILAKQMLDDRGREHFLVINVQSPMINKGQGSFSYYLFDETGKFEKGGLINGGQDFGDDHAWLDWGKTNLTIRSNQTLRNGSYEVEASFILTEHELVLKAPPTGIYANNRMGEVLYDTSP